MILVQLVSGCANEKRYQGDSFEIDFDSDYAAEIILEQWIGGVGPIQEDVPAKSQWKSMALTCRAPKVYAVRSIDPYVEGQFDRSRPKTPEGEERDYRTWEVECPAWYELFIDANGRLELELRADGAYDFTG